MLAARPARVAGQPRRQLHFHVRPKPNAAPQIAPTWASKRLPLLMGEWLSGGRVAPLGTDSIGAAAASCGREGWTASHQQQWVLSGAARARCGPSDAPWENKSPDRG